MFGTCECCGADNELVAIGFPPQNKPIYQVCLDCRDMVMSGPARMALYLIGQNKRIATLESIVFRLEQGPVRL